MKWAAGGFFALLLLLPLMLFAVAGNDKGVMGQGCGGGGMSAPIDPAGAAAALTPEQRSIAASIIGIGKQRSLPAQAWQTAIQAGHTESKLRNLPGGDRDSLGVFQMRPSMGWGTPAQLQDVTYQVNKFSARPHASTAPATRPPKPSSSRLTGGGGPRPASGGLTPMLLRCAATCCTRPPPRSRSSIR